MKVVLELQDQPSNVKKVTVRHDIVIGRGSDCNLRLSAPQISRRHCFLRVGREGVSVTDLDSSNGTFVDGKRLKGGVRQELVHGSLLALGSVRFLIRIKEDTVAEDVLKPAGQKQSSRSSTSKHSSDSSTVIGDANALLAGSQPPLARPMGLSVEQAGAAADSHDVTADLEGKAVHPKPESPSQKLSSAPPLSLPKSSDSVAEIAEPLERIAAGDSKRTDSFGGKPDDVAQADFESRATIADAADLLPPEEFSRPFADVAKAEVTETEPDAADAAPRVLRATGISPDSLGQDLRGESVGKLIREDGLVLARAPAAVGVHDGAREGIGGGLFAAESFQRGPLIAVVRVNDRIHNPAEKLLIGLRQRLGIKEVVQQ